MAAKIDRMNDLVEMFKNKNEIFLKKEDKSTVTEEALKKAYERMDKLANTNVNEAFYGSQADMGFATNKTYGQTVSTIADGHTNMYANNKTNYSPIRQPLTAEEALEIAIKRVISSGMPVNDLDFYAEAANTLNTLGFPAVDPLSIKNCLNKLIERGI